MNKLQLFRALRNNLKLCEQRSPMFERNKVAKVFVVIGMAVFALYMMAIGTALGAATKGGEFSLIFIAMPMILAIDFLMRTGIQQTPSMMVKPYLLLPLKRQDIVDCFLFSMLTNTLSNLWLCLFVPYVFICFCGGLSLWMSIAMLSVLYLLIIINSQWFLIVRTLAYRHVAFWLLPVAIYALAFSKCFFNFEKGLLDTLDIFEEYAFTPLAVVIYILLSFILFYLNRQVQTRMIDIETSHEKEASLKKVHQLEILNNFGKVGEYLKLEIKSALRNKTVKTRYVQGLILIAVLSLLIAYTDIYDGRASQEFWCLYCFLFFGATNLTKIMEPEGNFIDLLMVNKQNIYTLLQAKYYFYCTVLLLPTIILLPTVISGKFSIMMILAYFSLTSGPLYCILFQLAVYNKQTLLLNQKITGKGNFENTQQLIVELIVFILPSIAVITLQLIFGDTLAYAIVTVIGLIFTLSHNIWLRNIYRRMMNRRYENLEGFHSTR